MSDHTYEQDDPVEIPESESKAVSLNTKSRKKDVIVYSKNPFWETTQVKIGTKRVTIAGGYIAKEKTGEVIDEHIAGIHRIEAVDEARFIKLFTQNSALFFDLNRPAQKLLRFILFCVQSNPGKDGIWFTWRDIETWIESEKVKGLSRPSYHRALAELLQKKLLAESERPNFYWINPHVFFNGDRMVFIQEYRKIKAPPMLPSAETKALKNDPPGKDESHE